MYRCYTNKDIDVNMFNRISSYMNNEHHFMKVFNVWMKMIDKNNYAYVGGKLVESMDGEHTSLAWRIYFTNGTSHYYMEAKTINNGKNEILEFQVLPYDNINAEKLDFLQHLVTNV